MKIKITVLALALTMIPALSACAGAPAETTGADTAAQTVTETETEAVSETDAETKDETTAAPTKRTAKIRILGQAPIAPDRTIVYGTAEPDSVIRTVINGVEEKNVCNGKYFYIEITASQTSKVKAYATAPGMLESRGTEFTVTPADEEKTVFGGRDSHIFYLPTLNFLTGNSADTGSLDTLVQYIKNKTVPEIQKATGKKTKLLFAVIPDPATAHINEQRDYIKAMIPENKGEPAMTTFINTVNGCHEDVYAVDLLPVFRQHTDERIYFSTDTHYTELGAYYAYLEIMKTVKKDFPDATVRTVENGDYTVEYNDVPGGDMCGMIGMSMREVVPFFIAGFEDTGSYYVSKRNDGIKSAGFGPGAWQRDSELKNSNNPTAYFLGDSYGCYILPFIGANFSKVWTNEGVLWNYSLDKELLEKNRPDYVIMLVCQRNVGPDFMNNVISEFCISVAGF